jgi:hypothetical protein
VHQKEDSMDKNMFLNTIQEYKELGMSNLIDYDKFYLYSIVTHSTAIEGSTMTEVENQVLFERWLGKLTHLDYVIKKLRANTERVLIQLGYASLRRGSKKAIVLFKRLRHSGFCSRQRFDDGSVTILAFGLAFRFFL